MSMFAPAAKQKLKGRIAVAGPSGSGKTYTALSIATGLADGGRIAFVDTENRSGRLYADVFDFEDAILEPPYHPDRYRALIRGAVKDGFDVLVIDSITHAWNGTGGVLEIVDDAKKRFSGNSYMAWSVGTPLWRGLLDEILSADLHVIVTVRSKTDYVQEGGNVRKVGLAPEARDGIEYEFSLMLDMDLEHDAVVSKTRMAELADMVISRPDDTFGKRILDWLNSGTEGGAPAVDTTQAEHDLLLDEIQNAATEAGYDDQRLNKALEYAQGSVAAARKALDKIRGES